MRGRWAQLKVALHPLFDPALSWSAARRAQRALAGLPDGDYSANVTVPYYAQFATPTLVYDYIHRGYDGTQDPNWRAFGAGDPAEYTFWAPRACALAVLKMAIETFTSHRPTLWQLVQEGLALGGYTVRDTAGRWVDAGWYVDAQVALAARYGVRAEPRAYVSPLDVCAHVHAGHLVAATVTPTLGERPNVPLRGYGGHAVLVHGFAWRSGQPVHYVLHNPSGRHAELRANARILAPRFARAFAHRLMVLRPVR